MPTLFINGRFLCQRMTGVQRVSLEIVRALDRLLAKGDFPHLRAVLVAPRDADFSNLHLEHVETEHLGGGNGHRWEQVALALRTRGETLLCLGNSAPIASLLAGRVAVMLHDQSYRLFPKDYSRSYRAAHSFMGHFILGYARPLLAVSHTEAAVLRGGGSGARARIVVTPNGSWANDEAAGEKPRYGGVTGRFVLHVGGFTQRKNAGRVFDAAAELAKAGIQTKLVGEPNAASAEFLQELDESIRSQIQFTGYVDNIALSELYRGAACLLYPSLYEASGLPPTEAMSFGCPVVTSDLPVMHERCGEAALYCDPFDHRTFVSQVLRVIREPQLAEALSAAGLEQAKQFTWEQQARRIVQASLEI